jgi:adenine-specific DNA-methyltransferase
MDGKSLDINAERLAQLRSIFPEVFSEDKLDLQRLKQALGEDVFVKGEYYELSWAGKSEARKEVQRQTTATLIPNKESSIDFDKAQNVFIEGENLEVLRVLQKSYFGKIKMIYIDPPYNTGNDSFIYPDDYTERQSEYKKRTGITNDNGFLNKQNLWKKNTKENGQFHSVWLSMMYPRLYLSRNLLKEDGVIFISIDDNEVNNLKLLCDEVFGEENFVADIIWHSKYTTSNDAKYTSRQHEHILFYAKSLQNFEIGLLDRTKEMDNSYKNNDNDPKGRWKPTPLHAKSGSEDNNYTIEFSNGKTWSPPKGRYPRYSKSSLLRIYNEGGLYFNKKGGIDRKTYLSEVKQGKTVGTVWSFNQVGSSHQANEQLASIIDKGIFDNPKPLNLIKTCIKVANCSTTDIIMDFFAGSGTTAQAVLELNEAKIIENRFICIQMPEPTDEKSEAHRIGCETISDITKMRMKKVIENIKKNREGKLELEKKQKLSLSVFTLAKSNFKIWNSHIGGKNEIANQLDFFKQSEQSNSEADNMFYELCLKLGLGLNLSHKKENNFYKTEKDIWFCFEKYEALKKEEILKNNPKKVLFLNSSFEKDMDLTNFRLELKSNEIDLLII